MYISGIVVRCGILGCSYSVVVITPTHLIVGDDVGVVVTAQPSFHISFIIPNSSVLRLKGG